MSATLITLIVNALLALFVISGFLWGLGRGFKKSIVRFAYFVGFVVIFALISPFISQALLGIKIGSLGSLQEIIENAVKDIDFVKKMLEDNPEFLSFIVKLPAVVVNLVLFVILVILAKILSWIPFKITAKLHMNDKKKNKKVKEVDKTLYTEKDGKIEKIDTFGDGNGNKVSDIPQPPKRIAQKQNSQEEKTSSVVIMETTKKPKKLRLLGGLVGAVQGFVIMFLLLLPITGVTKTFSTYVDSSYKAEVSETADIFEFAEVSEFIYDNVPEDVISYIDAYNNSILCKVSGVGNFDLLCFDSVSTIRIDGEKISLRQELNSVVSVFEGVLYVQSIIEDDNLDWKDLNFDKLNKAIDTVFNSSILEKIINTSINTAFNEILAEDSSILEDNESSNIIREFLIPIQEMINSSDRTAMDCLKTDIKSVLKILQALCESGLLDYIQTEPDFSEVSTMEHMLNLLQPKNNQGVITHDYIKDITDALCDSGSIKSTLVGAVNVAMDELKTVFKEQFNLDENDQSVKFSKVTVTNINWDNVKTELSNITNSFVAIMNYIIATDTSKLEEASDYKVIKTLLSEESFDKAVNAVATILNTLKDSSLFKGTENGIDFNLFEEVIKQVNRFEQVENYNLENFYDFDYNDLMTVVKDIKNFAVKNVFSVVTGDEFELNAQTLNQIIDKALIPDDKGNIAFEKTFKDLIAIKSLRTTIIDAFNQTIIPLIEQDGENFGRIDKTVNWEDWDTVADDLNNIVVGFMKAYRNLNITNFDDIKEGVNGEGKVEYIFNLIFNENFVNPTNPSSGTANLLGDALQKILTNELFTYQEGDAEKNIIENIFTSKTKDIFDSLDIDVNEFYANLEQNSNYLKTELEKLNSVANLLLNKEVEIDGEKYSIINALTNENLDADLKDILSELSSDDVNTITNFLCETDMFKKLATTVVNGINTTIITYFDKDYKAPETTVDKDLKSQKTDISAILNSAINILKMDISDLENDILASTTDGENLRTNIKALLTALNNNKTNNGSFAGAFDVINDKFNDIVNDANKAMVQIVDETYDKNIAKFNMATKFDEVIEVLQTAKVLKDANIENFEDELVNNTNDLQTKVKDLLTVLEKYGETGVFADAYKVIFDEFYDIVNEANKTIIQFVNSSYNTDLAKFDVVKNFDGIMDVLEIAKDLEDAKISDIDALVETENENSANFKALLTTMKNEIVFQTAYDKLYNELYKAVNDANEEIIKLVDNGTVEDISVRVDLLAQFESIVEILNSAKTLTDGGNISSVDDVVSATNSEKFETLLVKLKANAEYGDSTTTNGVFKTAYDKLSSKVVEAINTAISTVNTITGGETQTIATTTDISTNFVNNAKVLNAIIPLNGKESMAEILSSQKTELIALLTAMQENYTNNLIFKDSYFVLYNYLEAYNSEVFNITATAENVDWSTALNV